MSYEASEQSSSKVKKTRYRVPTVCTVCRKRKMKCDKAKPYCTSCVRNKTTHSCVYEDQPWNSVSETQRLKDQVFKLQQQNNELRDLLKQANANATKPNIISDSNLDLSSEEAQNNIVKNYNYIIPEEQEDDPITQLTETFDLLMLKESKMSHFGSTSLLAVVTNDPILRHVLKPFTDFRKWGINLDKFYLYDQGFVPKETVSCGVQPAGTVKSSVFENEMSPNHEDLISRINGILPSYDIIWGLIDHFFNEAYAFMPFIEEKSFRKNVESLVSQDSQGNCVLVVNNVSLLTSVAVLLTVLRLAYITLPLQQKPASSGKQASNNSQLPTRSPADSISPFSSDSPNTSPASASSYPPYQEVLQRIQFSSTSISPVFIEYAKACISNASALRKPTLKHIQALLILRIYRYYSAEDGDDSVDSTIFLALIVQMAKMHGLHRDPSRFPAVTDFKTSQVWRKIWVQLMHFDALQSIKFGCPLLIDDEYDTGLPVLSENDTPLERQCVISLIKTHEVTLLLRDVAKSFTLIKTNPRRSTIEGHLQRMESVLLRYQCFDDLSTNLDNPNESFIHKVDKIKDIMNKLNIYQAYAVIYHILMLTCPEDEVFKNKKYFGKAVEATLIVFKFSTDFLIYSERFSEVMNLEIFTFSSFLDSAKTLFHMLKSYELRYLTNTLNLDKIVYSFTLPDSKPIKSWLSISPDIPLGDALIYRDEEFLHCCGRLSSRYFVCWRLVFYLKMFDDYLDMKFPNQAKTIVDKINNIRMKAQEKNNQQTPTLVNRNFAINTIDFWGKLVDNANQSNFDYLTPNLNKFDNITDPFFNQEVGMTLNPEEVTGDGQGFNDALSSDLTFQEYNTLLMTTNNIDANSDQANPLGQFQELSSFIGQQQPSTDGSNLSQGQSTSSGDNSSPYTTSSTSSNQNNISPNISHNIQTPSGFSYVNTDFLTDPLDPSGFKKVETPGASDTSGYDVNYNAMFNGSTGLTPKPAGSNYDHDVALQIARSMFSGESSGL